MSFSIIVNDYEIQFWWNSGFPRIKGQCWECDTDVWYIIKQLNIGRSPRCNGCQPSYRNIFSWRSMLALCEPEMFQPPANSITACKVSITTNKTLETHNPGPSPDTGLWSTQDKHPFSFIWFKSLTQNPKCYTKLVSRTKEKRYGTLNDLIKLEM